MLSLLLLICMSGISSTSFKLWPGMLKWSGTESSSWFMIPRLCSPKRSLSDRQVCPIYWEGSDGSWLIQRLQLIMYMRFLEEQEML